MIFIHSFLSLNQSNFSFPTHPSSMCLFCQSINHSLFDSKLVVCSDSIHQSISSINQWNEINQTNQLSFLLHTLFSINQCQSSVISSSSILSFHLSSLSNPIQSINQSIKRDQLTDRQDRRTDIDEWMNELKSISLTSQFMCNWSQRVNSILFDCLFPFPTN